MNSGRSRVLLIGEGSKSFAGIVRRLEKSGCGCRFANSYAEALRLIETEPFELVLSVIPPREKAVSSLASALKGTRATVFYAHLVEDSCWWVPSLRDGAECFGTPALRPAEFTGLLDRLVGIAPDAPAAVQPAPSNIPPSAEPAGKPNKHPKTDSALAV